jgi:hypothetical protein
MVGEFVRSLQPVRRKTPVVIIMKHHWRGFITALATESHREKEGLRDNSVALLTSVALCGLLLQNETFPTFSLTVIIRINY